MNAMNEVLEWQKKVRQLNFLEMLFALIEEKMTAEDGISEAENNIVIALAQIGEHFAGVFSKPTSRSTSRMPAHAGEVAQ
jgi:hypothetical protein